MKIVDILLKKFVIQTYNVGFVEKRIDEVIEKGLVAGDIHWVKHHYKDRFFADPFLYREDEQYFYVLCEEFLFYEEKGKITLLKISKRDYSLYSRRVIIEEDTHLSFPFCKFNGNTVIPESCKSGKVLEYTLDESFNIIKREQLLDEGLIDTVFYDEQDGTSWMYTAKMKIPSSELYIYRRLKGEKFKPNPDFPVLTNNRITRSAGDFFESNGKLFRPVQDCAGRYGRQTKVMEILKIGKEGYEAKEVITLNSFSNPPYDETLHTFNVYSNCIVVDGSKDYIRFPMKIFYKKMGFVFKFIKKKQ